MSLFKWKVVPGDSCNGALFHFSFLKHQRKYHNSRRKKTTATAATENGYKFGEEEKKLLHSSSAAPDNKYVSTGVNSLPLGLLTQGKWRNRLMRQYTQYNAECAAHIVIEHAVHIVIELPTGHNTQYSNALYSQHLLWTLRSFRE